MTDGQQLAFEQLQSIIQHTPESFEIIETKTIVSGSVEYCWIRVSAKLGTLDKIPGGLPVRTREQVWIVVHPDFPFVVPRITVPHKRFAGFPHVQWMRTLCLYQAPSTEWDCSDGMYGLLERLLDWFKAAAHNDLDPIGAPLHPPVAYSSADAPQIVPTWDAPVFAGDTWCGWVDLHMKTHHIQFGEWHPIGGWSDITTKIGAAILFQSYFPFEYPATVPELVALLETHGLTKKQLALIFEGAALRSDKGEPLFVAIGAPMRGIQGADQRVQHLSVWMIDGVGADSLRIACEKYSSFENLRKIGDEAEALFFRWCDIGIEAKWCPIRENRPEIVVARDHQTSLSVFKGKSVSLWGCGALGSHIAEMLVRAGIRRLILRDYSKVAPGLLCRQLFEEDDVGRGKVFALRDRLQKINSTVTIEAIGINLLSDPLDGTNVSDDADIIVDTSANRTLLAKLELKLANYSGKRPSIASMAVSSNAKAGIFALCQPDYRFGPFDALRRAKIHFCRHPELKHITDIFWPKESSTSRLFQPEPGCSDPTFSGSSADLMALSGALLNELASVFNNLSPTKCAAGVFDFGSTDVDQPTKVLKDFSVWHILKDPQHGYEIRIDPNALSEICAWIRNNGRDRSIQAETGGLLFGEWDESTKICWVDEVSGPPPDSVHSDMGFISGVIGCSEINDEKKRRSRGSVRYIGNWHTHPVSGAVPSSIDLSGMYQILSRQDDTPSKSLLLIIGNASGRAHWGAHVFSRQEFDLLRTKPIYRRSFSLAPLNCRNKDYKLGLTLSGGGLRAVAFHLGCLRALHDRGVLQNVKVISAVSGGSIIAAMYAYNSGSFGDFEDKVLSLLRKGLVSTILVQLLKPSMLGKCLWSVITVHLPSFLINILKNTVFNRSATTSKVRVVKERTVFAARPWALTQALRKELFGDTRLTDSCRNGIKLVLNATELRTGTAFRFGNSESGCWRYGKIEKNDILLAKAVAASAMYPLAFPSLDEMFDFVRKDGTRVTRRVLLTDGGVYDNLGVSCLDPTKDSNVSLSTYRPEYLIVCDAGRGTFSGNNVPLWFLPRVASAFESVFRKAHDAAIGKLFEYTNRQLLLGFALPYLGQDDNRLPYLPPDLIRLEDVKYYPTNFSPMRPEMIEKLSKRGEQLTRMLIDYYLPDL